MVNVNTAALRKLGKIVAGFALSISVSACAGSQTAAPTSLATSGVIYQSQVNPNLTVEVLEARSITTEEGIEGERRVRDQVLFHTAKADGTIHTDVGATSAVTDDPLLESLVEAAVPGMLNTATGALLSPVGAALGQRLADSSKQCSGSGCPGSSQPPVVLNNYTSAIAEQTQDQAAHLNSAVSTGGMCGGMPCNGGMNPVD